jgi:hypothetical protein
MAGGLTRLVSAASTNVTQVKTNSCNLKGFTIINTNAAARYVKLYDTMTPPVVGTDAVALTILVPASSQAPPFSAPDGWRLSKGLYFATTTGVADSDSTGVGAGDLIIQLFTE